MSTGASTNPVLPQPKYEPIVVRGRLHYRVVLEQPRTKFAVTTTKKENDSPQKEKTRFKI